MSTRLLILGAALMLVAAIVFYVVTQREEPHVETAPPQVAQAFVPPEPPPVVHPPPMRIVVPGDAGQTVQAPTVQTPSEEQVRAVKPPGTRSRVRDGELTVEELQVVENEGELSERELRRVVDQVKPLIQQCFGDVRDRYREGFTAQVSFRIKETLGGPVDLGRAEIDQMSVEDPYVRACLEDSPLDTQIRSTANGQALVRVPLRFSPSDR